jgi:hypothetical protein
MRRCWTTPIGRQKREPAHEVGDGLYLNPNSDDTVRLNADDLGRMAKKYDLGGIILRGLQYTDGLEQRAAVLVENVAAAIDGRTPLGVLLEDGDLSSLAPIAQKADWVLPVIRKEVSLADEANRAACRR